MRSWIFVLLLVAACGAAEVPKGRVPDVVGRLEDGGIREASGLARSQRKDGVLWVINDGGSREMVHAIDHEGARVGEFILKKSENTDWEDLASFSIDDKPYLMIADIGDNAARRKSRTLYFAKEPKAKKKAETKLDWEVEFVYPDGPRDAESAAVDVEHSVALILSKRDLPPRLYSVPLKTVSDEVVTATPLGNVTSLNRPSRQDIEFAPKTKDLYWQPVGMDISADGLAAVILTYGAVYYYERQPGQSWLEALNSKPERVSTGNFRNAEAVSFGDEERTVFVTGENKNSRLLRIDFNEALEQ